MPDRPEHLAEMIRAAIAHRGFSYLHVMANAIRSSTTDHTYQNLDLSVQDLPEDHDRTDRLAAIREATKVDRPAVGLYYVEKRPTLSDSLDEIVVRAGGKAAQQADTG